MKGLASSIGRGALGALLLSAAVARAQDGPKSQAKTTPYAMPELPAVAFIGGQANSIARPVTPRALATELVNGVDSAGRVKQGLAVAVTPFSLLGGSVTLSQYQGAWWKAALYNAQASIGSVRTAATAATDLGTGLRFTLYDRSDPMRSAAYTDSVRRLLVQLPEDPADADAAFAKARRRILDYRKEWRKENWNRSSLAVAAASGWRLNESRLLPTSPNRWLGWGAWATQAVRATSGGQLLGQVRYTNQRLALPADGAVRTSHQVDYGVRAIFGSAIVNFSAEVTGVNRSNPPPNAAKSGLEWAGGIEFRATEFLWIATSLGKKLSNNAGPTSAIVFAGLRWEINTEARMQIP